MKSACPTDAERTAAKATPRRKRAAQQRRDADAQAVTQSLREVFRKLCLLESKRCSNCMHGKKVTTILDIDSVLAHHSDQ